MFAFARRGILSAVMLDGAWKGVRWWRLGLAAPALLAGCGGNSIAQLDADGGGGSANSGGSAGASSAGAGGAPVCTPVDNPNAWEPSRCQNLDRLAVTDPWMADASGDGRVSAGEHVVVGVTVRDMSGLGYNSYPGVVFEVEEPGVEFVTDPRAFAIYALGRCDAVNGEVELAITQLEPPAVVRVVARAAELNRDCPDAPALEVSIPIE